MFVFQLMCEIRFKDHQQLDLVAAEGLFCFGHIVGHQCQVEVATGIQSPSADGWLHPVR